MPTWIPILLIALMIGGFLYWKKRKDDDDDDDDDDHDDVPSNPDEEANMNKFAVVVGINKYATTGMDLEGCVNDANNIKKLLLECCGFEEAGVKMLTDSQATKGNILAHLDWLVTGRKAGDELFYYHSGHGTQVLDTSGEEDDHFDEVLVSYDFDWDNPLLDDDISVTFEKVPQGTFLSMVCDSCHSGSMSRDMDKNVPMPVDMIRKSAGRHLKTRRFLVDKYDFTQRHILLSGCRDDQVSSETLINGMKQGLLTYNFVKECRASIRSWEDIHTAIIETLNVYGWTQIPVLSGMEELQKRMVFGLPSGKGC